MQWLCKNWGVGGGCAANRVHCGKCASGVESVFTQLEQKETFA